MGVAPNRSDRLHLTRRVLVSILLLAVVVTSVLVYVYYSVSLASVTGVTIQQVFADRKLLNGTYPNRNATFLFEIRVWSTTQYTSVNVEKPVFVVDTSGAHLGNWSLDSGTIYPGASLVYNLRITVNESRVGYAPFSASGDSIVLGMRARLTSGFYSQQATICDSKNWNWTSASITGNGGTNPNCSI